MEDSTESIYKLMKKECYRLKTFQMNPPWPNNFVDIKKLAKAGFFYTYVGDLVQCAFCRGQLCTWAPNDDPLAEHARHYTTCPFIMGGEVGNEPFGEDPFPGPKRPRPYDVCGIYQTYPPEHDANSSEQQYQNESVTTNDNHNHGFHNYTYDYGEELNSSSDVEQHQTQQQPLHDQPIPAADFQVHHTPGFGESPSESSINTNSSRLSPNSLRSNCSSKSSSSLNGICKICYTNSIELVFLPCGHSVSCLSCAHRLHNCPCCRSSITTRIRTFLV